MSRFPIRLPRTTFERFQQEFDEALWEKHPDEMEECYVRENKHFLLVPRDGLEEEP